MLINFLIIGDNMETLTVKKIVAALAALGVTTNQQVIETCDKIGLISKTQNSTSEARHFQKSYGSNARKQHLKNYAPGISIDTFVEIGLQYHEYKKWSAYKNDLSYALLGMAVLTGREPGMANGVFTKAGKSFARHIESEWAQWFYANESCLAVQPKAEPVSNESSDDLIVEYTVESSGDVEQLPPPPAEVVIDMSTLPPVDVLKPTIEAEAPAEVITLELPAPAKPAKATKRSSKKRVA